MGAHGGADRHYIGTAESMNDCAFKVWAWLQHHTTSTVNGATFYNVINSDIGHCYAAVKMDPLATANNGLAPIPGSRGPWAWGRSVSACLIRGPCQHIHVGDLAGQREEYVRDVADITDCAWVVAWRNDGANGATLYGHRCYAEYGADPYSDAVGFENHAAHVHAGHTSCILWEAQDEKAKKKRRKKCRSKTSGKSCTGRKNRRSRRGKALELQEV